MPSDLGERGSGAFFAEAATYKKSRIDVALRIGRPVRLLPFPGLRRQRKQDAVQHGHRSEGLTVCGDWCLCHLRRCGAALRLGLGLASPGARVPTPGAGDDVRYCVAGLPAQELFGSPAIGPHGGRVARPPANLDCRYLPAGGN